MAGQLIQASAYKSVEQAIASLALFSHPDTVRQTGCKALFPTIRNAARRGQETEINGRVVAYDDNKSPTDAFLWCNSITKKARDVQFNHISTAAMRTSIPPLQICVSHPPSSPN